MENIEKDSEYINDEQWEAEVVKFNQTVKEWIFKGSEIHLRDVPYDILFVIHRHFPPQCDWKSLACALGIKNFQLLTEIEGDAFAGRKWESEVLIEHCIKQTQLTFGQLISILFYKLKRIYILQILYQTNLVEDFFNGRDHKWLKAPVDVVGNNSKLRAIVTDVKDRNDDVILKDLSPLTKRLLERQDITCYQLFNANDQQRAHLLDEIIKLRNNKFDVPKQLPLPSQPKTTNKVVILLSYSKDAEELVPTLVQRMWDLGFGVVSEHVLKGKGYFETNLIASWEKFFLQSHFVVPILSRGYLSDIREPSSDQLSQGVRFVYDMYTRRYVSDGCLNHYVRPLLMDDVKGKMLKGINPTLEMRWKIWEDVDNFLNMIKQHSCHSSAC